LGSAADQHAGAHNHFFRRLACEGQQEYRSRVNAAIDQIRQPVHQCTGLSTACSGDDQGWTLGCGCRRELLSIESLCVVDRQTEMTVAIGAATKYVRFDVAIHLSAAEDFIWSSSEAVYSIPLVLMQSHHSRGSDLF